MKTCKVVGCYIETERGPAEWRLKLQCGRMLYVPTGGSRHPSIFQPPPPAEVECDCAGKAE